MTINEICKGEWIDGKRLAMQIEYANILSEYPLNMLKRVLLDRTTEGDYSTSFEKSIIKKIIVSCYEYSHPGSDAKEVLSYDLPDIPHNYIMEEIYYYQRAKVINKDGKFVMLSPFADGKTSMVCISDDGKTVHQLDEKLPDSYCSREDFKMPTWDRVLRFIGYSPIEIIFMGNISQKKEKITVNDLINLLICRYGLTNKWIVDDECAFAVFLDTVSENHYDSDITAYIEKLLLICENEMVSNIKEADEVINSVTEYLIRYDRRDAIWDYKNPDEDALPF